MPSDVHLSGSTKAVDNFRVVLPHSSCPPNRRVIAPSHLKRGTYSATVQKQNAPGHQNKGTESKSALSAKDYKEYMEDIELKIRYMKNDIEFKQNQIQCKKLLSAQISKANKQIDDPCVQKTHVSSKKLLMKTNKGASSTHLCIPPVHHKQVMSKYSYSQGSNSKIDTTFGSTSKSTLERPTNSPRGLEEPGLLTSSISQVSVGSLSSNTSISVEDSTQNETYETNFTSADKNSQKFTKVPTASVFQRLGGLTSVTPSRPIYVSPSKNQAIWSQSLNHPTGCHPWNKMQAQLSASFENSSKETMQNMIPCNFQTCKSSTFNNESVVASSKYKLVKPSASSKTVSSTNIVPYTSSVNHHALPDTKPRSIEHLHRKSSRFKSLMRKTPKSKSSEKFVSKYKLARLSPNSVSKVTPHSEKRLSFLQPAVSQTGTFNQGLTDIISHKPSVSSTPNSKLLKLETVIAAKLVSKYKLKRFSPISVSKVAPNLSHSPSTSFVSTPRSTPLGTHKISDCQVNPFSLSTHTVKAKALTFNTLRGNIPLRKSNHIREKQLSGTSGQNTNRRRFVLDRRNGHGNELKTGIALAFKNQHKLDRRPQKAPLTEDLTKFPGNLMTRKRIKNCSLSPTASTSSLDVMGRHQISTTSRFKWRRLSSTGQTTFPSQKYTSQFKWSKQRSLTQPSTWELDPKDKRDASWGTKSSLVMIRGVVYRSKWPTLAYKTKSPVLKAAYGGAGSSKTNMKLITLRGAHFHADSHGKKLCRAGLVTANRQNKSKDFDFRKRYKSQGKAVDETTILAASRVIHRSIAVAAAKFKKDNTKWKREKQHCIFFTRFGKCHRGGQCKYVHDPEKVAVCTRFLRGKCDEKRCQFSHNASEHKMPVCLHYLQGVCSRDNCPYLHVRVNPDAAVCKDFHHGYCPLGTKCKKLHSLVCPSFAVTGQCSRGESCSLLHRRIRKEQAHTKIEGNAKSKIRKRRKVSIGERSTSKKRVAESSNYSKPKPTEESSLETVQSDLDRNPNMSEEIQNVSEMHLLLKLKDSFATELVQNEEAKSKHAGTASLQIFKPSASSPKKDSAPLASQPSFISLLLDSPVISKPEVSLSSAFLARKSAPSSRIKPLFMAQSSSFCEVLQDKTKFTHVASVGIPNLSQRMLASVPAPSFLSNKMSKGSFKQ